HHEWIDGWVFFKERLARSGQIANFKAAVIEHLPDRLKRDETSDSWWRPLRAHTASALSGKLSILARSAGALSPVIAPAVPSAVLSKVKATAVSLTGAVQLFVEFTKVSHVGGREYLFSLAEERLVTIHKRQVTNIQFTRPVAESVRVKELID